LSDFPFRWFQSLKVMEHPSKFHFSYCFLSVTFDVAAMVFSCLAAVLFFTS
jgi:hypothetical protein